MVWASDIKRGRYGGRVVSRSSPLAGVLNEGVPKGVSVMIVLFILLGVFERVLPRIPAGGVRILSKVVGAVYLYYITSGGYPFGRD